MPFNISLSREKNANELLKYLLDAGINFELQTSNYTTTIILPDGLKQKFVMNKQSNRTFAAFSKITKDIATKKVPRITPASLVYFQHNFKENVFISEVMNIDLRSAYATILLNDGFITPETFEYLSRCNKQERLASVGMLASRKKIFQYKKGTAVSFEEIVSPKSGIFFYAVKKTYEIMSKLKQILGNDYLFTWVDGIYFLPNSENYYDCLKELRNHYFDFKTEFLRDFEVKIQSTKAYVSFSKQNSKHNWEKKIFHLPLNKNEYQKSVIQTFKTHIKTQNNETSKIKNAFS